MLTRFGPDMSVITRSNSMALSTKSLPKQRKKNWPGLSWSVNQSTVVQEALYSIRTVTLQCLHIPQKTMTLLNNHQFRVSQKPKKKEEASTEAEKAQRDRDRDRES